MSSQKTKAAPTKTPREILDLSITVMQQEIEKIQYMSKQTTIVLAPEDITSLTSIAKTLVIIDKNKKDSNDEDENDDIKNLSDAQLAELAKKILSGKDK